MPINEKMELFSVHYPFHKQVAKKMPLLFFYPSDLRKIALELELLLFDTIWRL